jgi:hypothetical protein
MTDQDRPIEHLPECEPEDMSEPDEEGIRDCMRCGLWEYPERYPGEREAQDAVSRGVWEEA